jgi:hypothetical protein
MILEMRAGVDGNTQLVVTSQAGYALAGPGFSPLVLSPCVPSTKP